MASVRGRDQVPTMRVDDPLALASLILLTLTCYCNCAHINMDIARGGDVSKLRAALKGGVSVNGTDGDGDMAIHYAVWRGHIEAVKYLVEDADSDIHWADVRGFTPLHYACYKGTAVLVVYLIKMGASSDMHRKNYYDMSPLDLCAAAGLHDEVVKAAAV